MSIGVRTRLGIWLFIVISVVTVASAIMLQTTRTRLVDSAEESLTQLSELEGARIAASLDDQRNAAEALALDTALLENLMGATESAEFDEDLRMLLGTSLLSGQDTIALRVLDRAGNELASAGFPVWESDRIPFAIDVMDSRETRVGAGFRANEMDDRFGVATPILAGDGSVLGALLLEVQLESTLGLSRQYESFSDTSEALVAQLDGGNCQLLTNLRFARSAAFTNLEGQMGERCLENIEEVLFRGEDYRGIDTLGSWTAIPETDWVLLVKMDLPEALELHDQIRNTLFVLGLVTAFLLIVGWYTQVRSIGFRLHRASRAATELSSGQFDALIGDSKTDEIGIISQSMDQLALDLAADISRREEAEERLRYRADFDDLTRAMNRHHTTDQLREFEKQGEPYSVIFLDLDGFKEINDTYGHSVGDEVLKTVANRLEASCARNQSRAMLGRWGGDEFVVVIPSVKASEIDPLVEDVTAIFDEPVVTGVGEHRVGASIGVADSYSREFGEGVEGVLSAADASMYQMKRRRDGRGLRVTSRSLQLVEEALSDDRIEAFLQPLVRIDAAKTVHLASAEALVRLRDESGELVSPGEFLPGLGASEQAMALDMRVLHKATERVAEWHRKGVLPADFSVAVNMGSGSLSDVRLAEKIADVINKNGLQPEALLIEIPETAGQVDPETIARLRSTGVRIAIDDVGCQYSNLERLADIDSDVAKIDRRWLPDSALAGHDRTEVLAGMIELCRNFGLEVVAEGIETPAQLEVVLSLGVDSVQGFLFGKPVDLASFEAFWTRSGGGSARFSEIPDAA